VKRTSYASIINAMFIPKIAYILTGFILYYSNAIPFNNLQFFFNTYGLDMMRYIIVMILTVRGLETFGIIKY
jgi:hypothetical protein